MTEVVLPKESCLYRIVQYSQYHPAGPATPMKSAAVPTVGGRGAVQDVLKNKVNAPIVENAETTTIDFGQAEPGRDIFADKKDPKSELRAPAQEAEEPKVEATPSSVEKQASEDAVSVASVVQDEVVPGPPEEDAAEAERARKELFPDDVEA